METKMIDFYGDRLSAIRTEDGVYTPAKSLAEFLKLDWRSQQRKLTTNPAFSGGIVIMTIPELNAQPMLFIRADLIPFWLIQINANRIDPILKDKMLRYQREASKVLSAAFMSDELKSEDQVEEELEMIAKVAQKLANERRQRRLLETRVLKTEERLADIEEKQLGSGNTGYVSALGFLRINKFSTDDRTVNSFGRHCAKLCKELGFMIAKIPDSRFGHVNSYPISILEQAAEEFFSSAVYA
jgi:hypothetical protein